MMRSQTATPNTRAFSYEFAPTRATTVLIIIGSMLVPIALAHFFLVQSLRLDEAQSLWETSRGIGAILVAVASDVHVPLYHLLLHFWLLYVGNTIVIARLLSLLFFVLSIPAVYFLGERAYNARIALFAAFLFSISPFMNWYGSEIRMYTLFVFFAIWNQYFFLRIFKDAEPSDNIWALYVVTAVLGVYSHYFFFFNLAAQAVFYFMRRSLFPEGSFTRFLIAAGIVVVAIAPWAWYVYHLGNAGFQEPALLVPSFVDLFNGFSQFLIGFQVDAINTIFLSLWPVVVILGIFTLGRTQRISHETEYLGLTVLVPFVLAFVASYAVTPIFVSRYLIFTLPAFYLVISTMCMAYPPQMRFIAGGTLVVLMLLTLWIEIVSPNTPVKENYEGAVGYLNAHATAQDAILISVPFTIYPVQYYYHGPAAISTLPYWDQYAHGGIPNFSLQTLPTQIAQATQGDQNVFLLLSYDQGYEADIKNYFQTHYQQLYTQTFSDDLTLYVYRLRYNTDESAMLTSLSSATN